MPEPMKRTQVLLPEKQYRCLRREAESRGCSVGHLVREAVEEVYVARGVSARAEAARRLVAMRVPVAGWEQMEEEIARGAHDE